MKDQFKRIGVRCVHAPGADLGRAQAVHVCRQWAHFQSFKHKQVAQQWKHLRDEVERIVKVMQGKDLFGHSLVRPKLADVVSKGATLLNAMQDSVIVADLPEPAEKMHLPMPKR